MVDKANILIVDDEMGPRESMKMILHPFYNVYAAESGSDAVAGSLDRGSCRDPERHEFPLLIQAAVTCATAV